MARPDGQFTFGDDWGYFRVAGALRQINWDDPVAVPFDLSDDVLGWGVNLSSNINLDSSKRSVIRLQAVYGEGIQNYMNDAPADVGIVLNPGDPTRPIFGEALPILGLVGFLDLRWSEKWSTSIGYSRTEIDNTNGQAPDAYKNGQYALGNLLYYPAPNVMVGGELQWGERENFSDGFRQDGLKLQFSFRYNFAHKFGG